MQELSIPVANDDGTMTPQHSVYKGTNLMLEASKLVGQDLSNPDKYAEWMNAAGFVNVQHILFKWPANPWPVDQKHKTLGLWTLANTLDGIEGFTMAMFTRVLGWQPEDVQAFLANVRKDCKDRHIHNYYKVLANLLQYSLGLDVQLICSGTLYLGKSPKKGSEGEAWRFSVVAKSDTTIIQNNWTWIWELLKVMSVGKEED